jgi:hypothetical protein
VDRRSLLRQLTAAGAATAATSIVSSSPAFAQQASCCRGTSSYTLIPTCATGNNQTNNCEVKSTRTVTVCRPLPTSPMVISRTSTGPSRRPFFDELATIFVTNQVSGVLRVRNFIGYQNNCRFALPTFADATGFGSGNGSACGTTTNPGFDVANLFGSECGLFTVRIEVRNFSNPFGYSACFLRVG